MMPRPVEGAGTHVPQLLSLVSLLRWRWWSCQKYRCPAASLLPVGLALSLLLQLSLLR